MSARALLPSLSPVLTEEQVTDLARPLMGILEKFYQDPKNEEDFQKWLLSVEKERPTGASP